MALRRSARRRRSAGLAGRARSDAPRAAAATTWMALLAATTLGVDGSTLHAEVRADGELDDVAEYSLVVQSYEGELSWRDGGRPVGSIQRVVTGAELRRGVHVSLVELRDVVDVVKAPPERAVVLAWIERGNERLDYDARAARPQPGTVFGATRRAQGDDAVHISLNRTLAA